jgi:hypothetical protein
MLNCVGVRELRAKPRRRARTVKDQGKKPISNATINRSVVEPLRKLFIRSRTIWRRQFPREPIWRQHRLKEPPERVREPRGDAAKALSAALRPEWRNVNWEAKSITTIGKGGRTVTTPITPHGSRGAPSSSPPGSLGSRSLPAGMSEGSKQHASRRDRHG